MSDAVTGAPPRIALAEPTIGGNAQQYLDECLRSNYVSSIGPFVTRFEVNSRPHANLVCRKCGVIEDCDEVDAAGLSDGCRRW